MTGKPPDGEATEQPSGLEDTFAASEAEAQTVSATGALGQTMAATSDADSGPEALSVGAVVAETYTVTRKLGEGGFGAVWEATHQRLSGRKVAIKVLHGGRANEEMLTRFRHEAEAAARIHHPHIVDVLDYNTLPNGAPYIVLEYLEGEPLSARIARAALGVDEALRVAVQVGQALQAAHGEGVIHRDLKPDNIFLCRTDGPPMVKVLDFGISKIHDSDTLQTADQVVMGTPCYMSPEQAFGKSREADARSDIFSLGTILYEMLTGARAFQADSAVSTLYRIVHDSPAPLQEYVNDLPEHVPALVDKAMAKKPEARFQTMTEFIGAASGEAAAQTASVMGAGAAAAPPPVSTGRSVSAQSGVESASSVKGGSFVWVLGAIVLALFAWNLWSSEDQGGSASPVTPRIGPSVERAGEPKVAEPALMPAPPEEKPATPRAAEPAKGASIAASEQIRDALPCALLEAKGESGPCPADFDPWCDLAGTQIACCAPGLVPAGDAGACVCAPGGVSHQAAIDSGCARGSSEASREAIMASFKALNPTFVTCYDQGLEGQEALQGRLSIGFKQLPSGRPVKVAFTASSLPNAAAQRCILEALGRGQWSPPVDGSLAATVPLVLQPGKSAPRAAHEARPLPRKTRVKESPPPSLLEAQAAYRAGRYEEAVRFARRSLTERKTTGAYALMAKAYCKRKNLPDAKGALAKLRGAARRQALKVCRAAGLAL